MSGERRLDESAGEARPRPPFRSVLVLYESESDHDTLTLAVDLASIASARLTVAVPVAAPSWLVHFAAIDKDRLQYELCQDSERIARAALSQVPNDVEAVIRCVTRNGEAALAAEIENGQFDISISRPSRPGRLRRSSMRKRLLRSAALPDLTILTQ